MRKTSGIVRFQVLLLCLCWAACVSARRPSTTKWKASMRLLLEECGAPPPSMPEPQSNYNECLGQTHDCHANAGCTDTDDSFLCVCNEGFNGTGVLCTDIDECSDEKCDTNAMCTNTDGSFSCSCKSGFTGTGSPGSCEDINECQSSSLRCHVNAGCENSEGSFSCTCYRGFLGDGSNCSAQSFAVSTAITLANSSGRTVDFAPVSERVLIAYAQALAGENAPAGASALASSAFYLLDEYAPTTTATVFALFATSDEAEAARQRFDAQLFATDLARADLVVAVLDPPSARPFDADSLYGGTTAIKPHGLEIEDVRFDFSCQPRQCWVIDFAYTRGQDASANVLYLPRAEGVPTAAGDMQYTSDELTTFDVSSFPCNTILESDPSSLCCLSPLVRDYRTNSDFAGWLQAAEEVGAECEADGQPPSSTILPSARDFVLGAVEGLPLSRVESRGRNLLNQYRCRLLLDEEEARTLAGRAVSPPPLSRVQVFLGVANLNPTGGPALDVGTAQQQITLDRALFFAPSIAFQADEEVLEAALEAVPEAQLSSWSMDLQLSDEEACMRDADLLLAVTDTVFGLYTNASTGIDAVHVASFRVDRQGEESRCEHEVEVSESQRMARRGLSKATGTFDVRVAFADPAARINLAQLRSSPIVLSLAATVKPESITVDDTFDRTVWLSGGSVGGEVEVPAAIGSKITAQDEGSGSGGGATIGAVMAVLAGVGVVGLIVWRRRSAHATPLRTDAKLPFTEHASDPHAEDAHQHQGMATTDGGGTLLDRVDDEDGPSLVELVVDPSEAADAEAKREAACLVQAYIRAMVGEARGVLAQLQSEAPAEAAAATVIQCALRSMRARRLAGGRKQAHRQQVGSALAGNASPTLRVPIEAKPTTTLLTDLPQADSRDATPVNTPFVPVHDAMEEGSEMEDADASDRVGSSTPEAPAVDSVLADGAAREQQSVQSLLGVFEGHARQRLSQAADISRAASSANDDGVCSDEREADRCDGADRQFAVHGDDGESTRFRTSAPEQPARAGSGTPSEAVSGSPTADEVDWGTPPISPAERKA